jgi:hypothetical protein
MFGPYRTLGQFGPFKELTLSILSTNAPFLFLSVTVSPPTRLPIGACLQSCPLMFMPTPYSLVPVAPLLLITLLDCLAMTYDLRKDRYTGNVIPGKSMTQIKNTDGSFRHISQHSKRCPF